MTRRSRTHRDASALLSALKLYLDFAAENGPGCPSAGRTPPEWTRLTGAVEKARESATRTLGYKLTCLTTNIELYEQSTDMNREHRLSALIQARDVYRHTADPWKENTT